jgi:hypothetical protein
VLKVAFSRDSEKCGSGIREATVADPRAAIFSHVRVGNHNIRNPEPHACRHRVDINVGEVGHLVPDYLDTSSEGARLRENGHLCSSLAGEDET